MGLNWFDESVKSCSYSPPPFEKEGLKRRENRGDLNKYILLSNFLVLKINGADCNTAYFTKYHY